MSKLSHDLFLFDVVLYDDNIKNVGFTFAVDLLHIIDNNQTLDTLICMSFI